MAVFKAFADRVRTARYDAAVDRIARDRVAKGTKNREKKIKTQKKKIRNDYDNYRSDAYAEDEFRSFDRLTPKKQDGIINRMYQEADRKTPEAAQRKASHQVSDYERRVQDAEKQHDARVAEEARRKTSASNREANSKSRVERETRAAKNEALHEARASTVNNVFNRLESTIDKKTIGQTYSDLSKEKGFDKLNPFDRETKVLNSAKERHIRANASKEGIDVNDDYLYGVYRNSEMEHINNQIDSRRKMRESAPSASSVSGAAADSSPAVGGTSGSVDSSNWSTTDRYMEEKRKKIVNSLNGSLDQGGATDEVISHFSKKLGLKDKSEEFANLVRSKDRESLGSFLESQAGNYRAGANIFDSAVAHKVPQIAATGLGTAWLVSNMSANKGQQSNAQLYGQQQPYY